MFLCKILLFRNFSNFLIQSVTQCQSILAYLVTVDRFPVMYIIVIHMLSIEYMIIKHIVSVGQRYVALRDLELKTRVTTVENFCTNNEELTVII